MIDEEKDEDNSQSTDYPVKIESNNPQSETISQEGNEQNSNLQSKKETGDIKMRFENIEKELGVFKEIFTMLFKGYRIPVAVPMKFEN